MIGNIVAWVLQTTALAAAAGASLALLRARSPRVELALMQTLLAATILLPALQPWQRPVVPAIGVAAVQDLNVPAEVAAEPTRAARRPDPEEIAIALFAAGLFLRLLFIAVGLVRIARLRGTACAVAPHFEAEDLAGVRARFAVSAAVRGPVTFGDTVLLPPTYAALPPEQQRAIACHELVHIRRRDWLVSLAEQVAASIVWFHPAVWWLMRRIRTSREHAVDLKAVALTGSRDAYLDSLLAMADFGAVAHALPFLRRRDLADRVHRLMEVRPMSTLRTASTFGAVTLLLAVTGVAGVHAFPLAGEPAFPAPLPPPAAPVAAVPENGQAPQGSPAAPAPASSVVRAVVMPSVPDDLRRVVEPRVAALHGQAFTAAVMTQVTEDLKRIDPKLGARWFLQQLGGYVLLVEFATPTVAVRLSHVDVSNLPEHLRAEAASRLEPFRSREASKEVLSKVTEIARGIDPKIALRLIFTSGGHMYLMLGYDVPRGSGQPVIGLAKELDLSRVPETQRAEAERLVSPLLNRPLLPSDIQDANAALAKLDLQVRISNGVLSLSPPQVGRLPSAIGSVPQGTVRVGAGVMEQKLKRRTDPVYPPLARQARVQGAVQFQIVIDPEGRVSQITLVSGHPLLVPAATEAVRQWEYAPTLLNGQPVHVMTEATVDMRLQE